MIMMEAKGKSGIAGKVIVQETYLAQGAGDTKEKRVKRGRDWEEESHG